MLRYTGEHPRADLLIVVERKKEVGISWPR